jgi:hypothetical protein
VSGERDVGAEQIRQVRVGHGANCSSIGSVIDTLFATATVGAAVFAAVVAALRNEEVHVVERPERAPDGPVTAAPFGPAADRPVTAAPFGPAADRPVTAAPFGPAADGEREKDRE